MSTKRKQERKEQDHKRLYDQPASPEAQPPVAEVAPSVEPDWAQGVESESPRFDGEPAIEIEDDAQWEDEGEVETMPPQPQYTPELTDLVARVGELEGQLEAVRISEEETRAESLRVRTELEAARTDRIALDRENARLTRVADDLRTKLDQDPFRIAPLQAQVDHERAKGEALTASLQRVPDLERRIQDLEGRLREASFNEVVAKELRTQNSRVYAQVAELTFILDLLGPRAESARREVSDFLQENAALLEENRRLSALLASGPAVVVQDSDGPTPAEGDVMDAEWEEAEPVVAPPKPPVKPAPAIRPPGIARPAAEQGPLVDLASDVLEIDKLTGDSVLEFGDHTTLHGRLSRLRSDLLARNAMLRAQLDSSSATLLPLVDANRRMRNAETGLRHAQAEVSRLNTLVGRPNVDPVLEILSVDVLLERMLETLDGRYRITHETVSESAVTRYTTLRGVLVAIIVEIQDRVMAASSPLDIAENHATSYASAIDASEEIRAALAKRGLTPA